MSPPTPSPSLLDRLRRFDPAVLPIAVAAVVLVGAVVWLLGRPLPQPAARPDAATTQEIAALRERQDRFEAVAGRLAALEARPAPAAPDLAPLRQAIAALEARPAPEMPDLTPLRDAIAALEARPVPAQPDLAPLREAIAAADRRVQEAERRAQEAESQLAALGRRLDEVAQGGAPRAAVEQLVARVETAAREAQAALAQRDQRQAATEQSIAAFAGRVAANEAGLAQRGQAIEQLGSRLAQQEQQVGARIGQVEQQLAQRTQAIEQQGQRLAAVETAAQRVSALEQRAARLAAVDAVQMALDAGRPLGSALRPIADPPRPLARFADAAPPTLAQLRLGFEDAARAALAASEPARSGARVLEGAAARLQGLVTVRRGEEVVFGDTAAAEIERARRALEAGELPAALASLSRLSPPARAAMADWIGQAEALGAAR